MTALQIAPEIAGPRPGWWCACGTTLVIALDATAHAVGIYRDDTRPPRCPSCKDAGYPTWMQPGIITITPAEATS